jgi:hypothetical protein
VDDCKPLVRGDFTKSYLDGDGMVTSIAIKAGPHPHTAVDWTAVDSCGPLHSC